MSNPVHYHSGNFPPKHIAWEKLIPLIGPANAALARYDGVLSVIPNASVFLTPLTTQEAVLSSKIEGTQTTIGEVLEYEAQGELFAGGEDRKADIQEVLNYRKAMHHAEKLLKTLPLCQRVIKEAHSVLMKGVRGHGRSPGEYRKIPNWIGPPGCTIEEARYVPIAAEKLPDAMSDWEKYIHEEAPDRLVQLAIIHAEFEALHPFLDGNGRLGRMCVPLFMHNIGLIKRPMFYISAFFESNRDEYYERLLAISRDDKWTDWCAFFLRAVIEQAKNNAEKTSKILNLYEKKKGEIAKLTRSQYAIHAVDLIFRRPLFLATDFTVNKEIPEPTARRILDVLRKNGILRVIKKSAGRQPAMLCFGELVNITEGRKMF
jgi:Fic family protein